MIIKATESALLWDCSVAERAGHPDAETLKSSHYSWLLETGQDEEAAALREKAGDALGAISLYLKGGRPARAANVSPRSLKRGFISTCPLKSTLKRIVSRLTVLWHVPSFTQAKKLPSTPAAAIEPAAKCLCFVAHPGG